MPEDLLQPEVPAGAAPRPADVPAEFWDEASGALRTEALLAAWRALEARLAERHAPPGPEAPPEALARFRAAMGIPETPDGYAIEPPHDLCCADAAVNARLHAAHFSQDQAQLVYQLAAERLLPLIAEAAAEFEADRQRGRLIAHYGGEERFRAMAAQLSAWGKARLPPPVYAALSATAEGVFALERMMQGGEPPLAREATAPPAENEAELRALMRDPRYWRTREPAFVARVTEGFRRLVGG
ncbi:hypothetical protein JMJ55_27975 [Belnapia sp. T6]|uniref:Uncharacterized protein n=1 Tax=Belnapia mucosa TaxID=2804532 RepID=A0ABS1VBV8_9PROT|nr:hypothetical protein [Belnapia mucosa]MBL6459165.1 hypothetical protein [Belnapia mucosa]